MCCLWIITMNSVGNENENVQYGNCEHKRKSRQGADMAKMYKSMARNAIFFKDREKTNKW